MLSSSGSEPPDPVEVVRATAFQCALLDALVLTLPGPDDPGATAPGDALDFVESRLDRLHKQLRRAAKRFEESTPAEQHQARKRLKRLRYLGELAGSLYKPERVQRYLGRLSPAQDAHAGTSKPSRSRASRSASPSGATFAAARANPGFALSSNC